ncbi:hypothetical protein Adt_06351 [Abeliophyllum distichum]|uniref:DUF1308 domain-containing protein n=1 Tax=Abeliophyllum distichum TaxID=126358 RepID=A0ABD1V8V7_9LAMI
MATKNQPSLRYSKNSQSTYKDTMEEESRDRETMAAVEEAKKRCSDLTQRIIHTEKLSKLSSKTTLLSVNIGHLEAVVHVLQHPFVTGVSRVCKPIVLSPSKSIYVDIVCSLNGNPVWFVVSDRNPKYIFWDRNKGLKTRIRQLLEAANKSPVTLRPSSIIFFFANGLDDGDNQHLRDEFGATELELESFSYEELDLEEDWTNVNLIGRSFPKSRVLQIWVDKNDCGMNDKHLLDSQGKDILFSCKKQIECCDLNLGLTYCSLVSGMKCGCCSLDDTGREVVLSKELLDGVGAKLVNFDTTAMIAIVSGISNGGTEKLLAKPENELRGRFKGNYEFVIAQVNSEIQNPIHGELAGVISGKIGIICESVHSEFQELMSMCGGPNEISRANHFLNFLKVVPDCPSTRLMSLPSTRKLALKNKVVFGTGDYWHAPTITANMAFVRAVSQTGMSLFVIEHRPRALIGD